MKIRTMQERFLRARGRRFRREIVDLAAALPGAPESIDERHLREIECILQRPPANGRVLMALAAALGIEPLDILRDLGYWPPVPSPLTPAVPDQLLAEAIRLGGWRVCATGTRVVIEKG